MNAIERAKTWLVDAVDASTQSIIQDWMDHHPAEILPHHHNSLNQQDHLR